MEIPSNSEKEISENDTFEMEKTEEDQSQNKKI